MNALKQKLVVDVSAKIDWLTPPENLEDEIKRSHIDAALTSAVYELREEISAIMLHKLKDKGFSLDTLLGRLK